MHNREIVMAAWLSNIERFYTAGAGSLVQEIHSLLEGYLNVAKLMDIFAGSSNCIFEKEIVNQSMNLSLCETEQTEILSKGKCLTSVFSRVSVSDQYNAEKKYYALAQESMKTVFPTVSVDDSNHVSMEKNFLQEMKQLQEKPPASWEDFIVVFDTICRKYMWCITASDYEGEDISLYNQSRIAAAIAECLYESGKDASNMNEEHFKLLVCDFSGIQKYVFSVANISESGVAKRLRARSFYVDVTVSVIAQAIIRRFGLTQNHILMQTGGKFYLLLPNSIASEELLCSIEAEIDNSFFKQFKGQIAIHLSWINIGASGLENYSQSVTRLMRKLAESKSRAFHKTLVQEDAWNEEDFIISDNLKNKQICPACGSALMEKGRKYCRNCDIQTNIGQKLPRTKYICYFDHADENDPDRYPIYGEYHIGLYDNLKNAKDAFLVEQINEPDILREWCNKPIRVRYMANHIPTFPSGDPMTFSDIADSASGMKKLAVLKADVDSLGYIFADGLRKGKKHFGTISRVNTMSRFLEIFFSGYINDLLSNRSEFSNVYSVFSGGDDLFLIGPWDVMPKLAGRISQDFNCFAAGNPALTISAAISIFQPKEHIANLAEITEKRLKWIKNHSIREIYPEKDGRNGVSFTGEMYSWEDLQQQIEIGDRLAGLLVARKINTAMCHRIGIYSRMYREFLVHKDVMGLMFEPLFHYDRERNYKAVKRDDIDMQWFMNEYIKDLSKNMADIRTVKKNLYFAEATVNYAMNKSKEERMYG